MPWSGGSYTVPTNLSNFASAGGGVDVSVVQSIFTDVQAGINETINISGQNAAAANLPMGGFRHTGAGVASDPQHYVQGGQALKSWPVYMLDAAATDSTISVSGSIGFSVSTQASLSGAVLQVNVVSAKPVTAPITMVLNVGSAPAYDMTDSRGRALMPGSFVPGVPFTVYLSGSKARVSNPRVTYFKVDASLSGQGVSTTLVRSTLPLMFALDGDMVHMNYHPSDGVVLSLSTSGAANIPSQLLTDAVIPAFLRPAAQKILNGVNLRISSSVMYWDNRIFIQTDGTFFMGGDMPDNIQAASHMWPFDVQWLIASVGT